MVKGYSVISVASVIMINVAQQLMSCHFGIVLIACWMMVIQL